MKFELDDNERAKLEAWNKRHLEVAHNGEEPHCGAAGGRVSFVITPTGLGTIVAVECGVCVRNEIGKRVMEAVFNTRRTDEDDDTAGARCNLTDFSDW